MTAQALTDLLAAKHAKDVFVPQCKTGPTDGGLQILDAWAMRKSWANPTTWGYEIKVSRSDFLRDDKWRGYLDYCSEFYFVCSPGLIDPRELPSEVGLLVASTNLARLFTKKKAPHREVEIPEDLFRYVLMWRSEVCSEHNGRDGSLAYWRAWLEQREEKRRTGHEVRREINRLAGERIREVEGENRRLRHQIDQLEAMRRVCEELDIDPGRWHAGRELAARVAEIRGAIPEQLLTDLDAAEGGLRKLRERLALREARS